MSLNKEKNVRIFAAATHTCHLQKRNRFRNQGTYYSVSWGLRGAYCVRGLSQKYGVVICGPLLPQYPDAWRIWASVTSPGMLIKPSSSLTIALHISSEAPVVSTHRHLPDPPSCQYPFPGSYGSTQTPNQQQWVDSGESWSGQRDGDLM